MGNPDDFGARLLRYMAECMDWHEVDSDQEQNQIARHMAQFADRERRRIRRAIAPALKELRELAQGGFDNIDCDRITHAIRVATRAPRKARKK